MRTLNNQSGAISILAPLTLALIILMAALALDAGNLYLAHVRLQTVVDASTLFGSSMLIAGDDDIENYSEKTALVALKDDGFNPSRIVSIDVQRSGTEVDTGIKYNKNLWLASAIGQVISTEITVGATTAPPPIYVVLVLDTSGSMNCPENDPDCRCNAEPPINFDPLCVGPGCSCNPIGSKIAKLREAAKHFVSEFSSTKDKVAVVTYGVSATVVMDFTTGTGFDKPSVLSAIDGITAGGPTNASDGLGTAHRLFNKINNLEPIPDSAIKSVVLFSDGAQTAAKFKLRPEEALTLNETSPGEYEYYSYHRHENMVYSLPQLFGVSVVPDPDPVAPPNYTLADVTFLNTSPLLWQHTMTHPIVKAPLTTDSNGKVHGQLPDCYEVQKVDAPPYWTPFGLTHFYLDGNGAPNQVATETMTDGATTAGGISEVMRGATGLCSLDGWDLFYNACIFTDRESGQCMSYVNGLSRTARGTPSGSYALSNAEYSARWPNILQEWMSWCDYFWNTSYIREGRRRAGTMPSLPSWKKYFFDHGLAMPPVYWGPIYNQTMSSASWTGPMATSPHPIAVDMSYLNTKYTGYQAVPREDTRDFLDSMENIYEGHINTFRGGGDGLWVSQYLYSEYKKTYLDNLDSIVTSLFGTVTEPFRSEYKLGIALAYYEDFLYYQHDYYARQFNRINNAFDDYWSWWRGGVTPTEVQCVYSFGLLNPDPAMNGTPFEFVNKSSSLGPRNMYRQYHNIAIAEADYLRRDKITVYSIGLGIPAAPSPSDAYQDVLNYNQIKEYFLRRVALDVTAAPDPKFQGVPSYSDIQTTYTELLLNGKYKHTTLASQLDEIFEQMAGEIKLKLLS